MDAIYIYSLLAVRRTETSDFKILTSVNFLFLFDILRKLKTLFFFLSHFEDMSTHKQFTFLISNFLYFWRLIEEQLYKKKID